MAQTRNPHRTGFFGTDRDSSVRLVTPFKTAALNRSVTFRAGKILRILVLVSKRLRLVHPKADQASHRDVARPRLEVMELRGNTNLS